MENENTPKKRGRPKGSKNKGVVRDSLTDEQLQEIRRLERAAMEADITAKKRKPLTVDMKHAISDCFGFLGGITGFADWAKNNRTLFYTQFCTKMVPKDITFDANIKTGDGDMDVSQKVLSMLSLEQLERLEQMTIDASPIPQPESTGEEVACSLPAVITQDIVTISSPLEAAMTEVWNGIESELEQEPSPLDFELSPIKD